MSNIKTFWIFILQFIISIQLFSQIRDADYGKKIERRIDSLEVWNYDIIRNKSNDSLLICQIVFYRNLEPNDSINENCSDPMLRPYMIFNLYPISMVDSVKKMSRMTKMLSSCTPPNVGGDYYILKNYVLFNYAVCIRCSDRYDRQIDFCRGNIDSIISNVTDKEYNSYQKLLDDLKIKKGKFK